MVTSLLCIGIDLIAFCFVIGVCHTVSAEAQTPVQRPRVWTQRAINEVTAALEGAYLQLVTAARLRRQGESLRAYSDRIAGPLPAETTLHYRARLRHYGSLVDRAAEVTRPLHNMPSLKLMDNANRTAWLHAVAASQALAGEIGALRHTMNNTLRFPASRPTNTVLGGRLEAAILRIQDAREALRDARP